MKGAGAAWRRALNNPDCSVSRLESLIFTAEIISRSCHYVTRPIHKGCEAAPCLQGLAHSSLQLLVFYRLIKQQMQKCSCDIKGKLIGI